MKSEVYTEPVVVLVVAGRGFASSLVSVAMVVYSPSAVLEPSTTMRVGLPVFSLKRRVV